MQHVIEPFSEAGESILPRANRQSAATPRLAARVLRGGAWAVFGKCWNSLLIILANALLARILSLSDFAAFLLAFSCVAVLGNLGTLGLNVGIVRSVAESLSLHDVRRARRVTLMSWLMSLAGGLVVATGFGVILATFGSHIPFVAPLSPVAGQVAAWVVLNALAVVQGETFRGLHKIGPASAFGTPYNLPFLLGLSLLALGGVSGLSTILWLVLACQVISLLVGYAWIASLLIAAKESGVCPASDDSPMAPRWTRMLRESLPLAVTTAASMSMAQLDLWIVAAFCSGTDLAIYGAVTRLMLLVSMPVNIMNGFVPPLVADLHTRGEKRQLEQMLRSTATLASLPALAAFLFVLAAGGWLLSLFYGEAYRDGAAVLTVLSCGQLISAWCGCAGCALCMTGQQRSVMQVVVSTGLLLLAVGILAVRPAGVLGVALTSATATALQKLLLCWLVWRLLDIRAYGTWHFDLLWPARRNA